MKILLLTRKYTGVDGHSTVINNVAMALIERGIDVTLGSFSFLQDPPSKIPKIKFNLFSDIFIFDKIIRDFDLIHNFQTLSSYTALITKKPYVFHYLGIGTSLQGINLKIASLLTKHSIRKYIVSSKSSADELYELIQTTSQIIPLAIDPNFYNRESTKILKKGYPQLLTVTRMMSYKRNEDLLHGFSILLKILPKAHLRIIGTGPQFEQVKNLVDELKISSQVELLGKIPHSDIKSLYASCDVYVSTSAKEAFPLPVIECMAQGKPVILSDIPIHQEIIHESKAGQFYVSGNANDLAEKLIQVWNEKDSLGKNAIIYSQKWSREILGSDLIKLYKDILDN